MAQPIKKTKELTYFEAVGRRKESIARARIYLKPVTVMGKNVDKGSILFNGRKLEEVYPKAFEVATVTKPLTVLEANDRYAISLKVVGGGATGQLEAASHAISRALEKVDATFRTELKANGLLTRDPRIKERRKVGTGGKARRAKQSPKR